MGLDKSGISQALAKTIAFLACGKRAEASHWARRLVSMLTDAGVEF